MNDYGSAHAAVSAAIARGDMPPAKTLTCTQCSNPARDYHHHEGYDQSHWLTVIPLCRSCHRMTHGPRLATPLPEKPFSFGLPSRVRRQLNAVAEVRGTATGTTLRWICEQWLDAPRGLTPQQRAQVAELLEAAS